MIDYVLEMKVDIVHFDLQALNTPLSMHQVYSTMPQVAHHSYAKAAHLCLSGADWEQKFQHWPPASGSTQMKHRF